MRRPDPLRCGRIQVGLHRLFVRTGVPDRPDGPPVMLIPGLVVSSRYLAPTAVELAASRLVVAPDLPGSGRSPHAARPLTIPELADTVHGLITSMTGPAVVVANSFGCQVAVELALRHPDAVRRLVLTGPVAAPRTRNLPAIAARWVAAMRFEPPRLLGIVLVDALRGWAPKGYANLRALLAYQIEQRAHELTVPALVVRGRRDALVPAPFARRLAAVIPRGDYVEVPGGHALPYHAPRTIARLVLSDGVQPPG